MGLRDVKLLDIGAAPAARPNVIRSPLRHLDPDAVSQAARVETRNREVHLPPVTAYRWWARRTESINGAILDAFARDQPNKRFLVIDPFVGGGIIPLAAVIRGHRAYAQDLNPWATSGLVGMLRLAAAEDLANAANRLGELAASVLDDAYGTTFSDGRPAQISHTFRVATAVCSNCKERFRLYPHAVVSLRVRRERGDSRAFLACPAGHLFEGEESGVQNCLTCCRTTDPTADYTPRRLATCPACGTQTGLAELGASGTWAWEVVLVERATEGARELAIPTAAEVAKADGTPWQPKLVLGDIPVGQETNLLRRHGFKTWNDIYPARQRLVLETLLDLVPKASEHDATVRALRLAIIGSAEMAGHLSRWDRYYLKSYESMAGHRFNFTTFAAEPNVWGTRASGRGSVRRRIVSFAKAAAWLRNRGAHDLVVEGPLFAGPPSPMPDEIDVRVVEGSSEAIVLPDRTADIALTDPPYHDDVQYGELSLPLRAWAELSLDALVGEALVNNATGHNADADDYTAQLTTIFRETHRVLRRNGHLVFSYANREPRAWRAVLAALHAANFRAVGYVILHSENETDIAKRDVRACTLDLLMDLVPVEGDEVVSWHPTTAPGSDEGTFLRVVGDAFLSVGDLTDARLDRLVGELATSPFLTKGPD